MRDLRLALTINGDCFVRDNEGANSWGGKLGNGHELSMPVSEGMCHL